MKAAQDADAASAGPRRILVIRHGALGDFILSLGPLAAIRRHHPDAHITLLTSSPFVDLARQSGYVDEVWTDDRPKPWHLASYWRLVRRLRRARFDRVYDLQTSGRTARYWRQMGKPDWSGHVPGCSLPDPDPDRDRRHTADRQRRQLAVAGIADVPPPDLSWARADIGRFGIRRPFALLVPGGSAHRLKKRWPAEKYAALCRRLLQRGVTPVLIGSKAEADLLSEIAQGNRGAIALPGETGLGDLAELARGAVCAVGNDTGPMHLFAAAGCPSLVLFSDDSDPALCAPRPGAAGGRVNVLRRVPLSALSVGEVEAALPLASADGRGDADA